MYLEGSGYIVIASLGLNQVSEFKFVRFLSTYLYYMKPVPRAARRHNGTDDW